MATKAVFTSAFNTLLSIVITKAKVLLALGNITDEFWKAEIEETQATTFVVTKTYVNSVYEIKFKKVGNTVFVDGAITVTNGVVFNTGQVYFTFTNSEFRPKTGSVYYLNMNQSATNDINLLILDGTAGTSEFGKPMPSFATYTVSGSYTTND